MARTDYPLDINRRRLLVSAAALPAASIVPIGKPADTAAAGGIRSSAMAPEAEPANFSPAMARRLLEIARRNEIRQEADLPLLSIPKELRRLKRQEDAAEFERFAAVNGGAVLEQMLKRRRQAEGNLNWRPNFIEGMSYQNQVREILREQFRASSRPYTGRKATFTRSVSDAANPDGNAGPGPVGDMACVR